MKFVPERFAALQPAAPVVQEKSAAERLQEIAKGLPDCPVPEHQKQKALKTKAAIAAHAAAQNKGTVEQVVVQADAAPEKTSVQEKQPVETAPVAEPVAEPVAQPEPAESVAGRIFLGVFRKSNSEPESDEDVAPPPVKKLNLDL